MAVAAMNAIILVCCHPTTTDCLGQQIGLFRAGSLARHLLLFTYISIEVAINKTYLIELVRDMPPLGTKEKQRATTDISSRNNVVK